MSQTGFIRVSREKRCPLCQKPDWCLISADGEVAICARISEGAIRAVGDRGAGWLHVLKPGVKPSYFAVTTVRAQHPSRINFSDLASEFEAAVSSERLRSFTIEMGLDALSLRRLGLGWATRRQIQAAGTRCNGPGCWTFPMKDDLGRIVGIRLRTTGGFKYAIAGSADGLFIPADLAAGDPLIICEGPTDTAALLDLGFRAVGRSSCTGGSALIVRLVRLLQPSMVVIMSDRDAPGERGAQALGSKIVLYAPVVKIVSPPEGIKDARAWKEAGANRQDVLESIAAVTPQSFRITTGQDAHRSQ